MTRNRLITVYEATEDQGLKDMILYALTANPLARGEDEVYLKPDLEELPNPVKHDYGSTVRFVNGGITTIARIGPRNGLLLDRHYNRYWDTPFRLPITRLELETVIRMEPLSAESYLPIKIN